MKRIITIIFICFVIIGCATGTNNNQNQTVRENPNALKPDDIIGKRLSGSDNYGTFVIVFNENNVFEYTLNGKRYVGEWHYDPEPVIMKYNISWNENGTPNGYLVDVIRRPDNKLMIHGYWYLTDAFLQFSKIVIIE